MSKETLHIIPHTHWDREWYMGFEQHRMRLVELFDTLIDVMEKNPDYTYFHMDGQYVVIQDYLEVRPSMRDRLLALIRAGRIQVGPWYVLQDEYLTSGESNVRNMLYGIRFCRELGAEPVMSGYFPDAFGNISQAPQILRGFGIDNAIFGRGVTSVGADNAIAEKSNPSEWRWRSPDGSEVVGVMFSNWYHNAMELPTQEEALKARLDLILERTRKSAYTPHLLGMNGCDHQPIQTDLTCAIDLANELLKDQDVTVKQSNFKDYVAAVKPYAHTFPQVTGELNGQGTDGIGNLINTASTHIPMKQENWACQSLLTGQAEPVNVLSARCGDTYREDMLIFAWKKLMENHPHDTICACSCDEVAAEMASRFSHARQTGEYVRDEAMDYLCRNVSSAGKGILVFHGHAGTDTEMITTTLDYPLETSVEAISLTTPDGSVIPVALKDLGKTFTYTLPKDSFRKPQYVHRYEVTFPVTITGIGYALYQVRETAAPENVKITVSAHGAETATMAVDIAPNGTLTVTDKKSGISYSGLNSYEDVADRGESYNFSPLPDDCAVTTLHDAAKIWVESQSDVSVTFGVENHWCLPVGLEGDRRSQKTVETPITTYVTLTAGIDRVDIKTTFCNQSEDHRVRTMFAPHIQTAKCLSDGQFDLVARDIYPAWKQFANPSNCQRSQAFFALEDESKGLAVACRGLHEHEVLRDGENTMALTLLRCVGWMGDWGIFPTPKMQLKGEHTLEYSVIPYARAERAKAYALAHSFAENVFAAGQVEPQQGCLNGVQTLVAVDNAALVTSACKRSEDRRFTAVRLYNPLEEAAEAVLYVDTATVYESNLAENVGEKLPVVDGKVKITVPAKKIVTYLLR